MKAISPSLSFNGNCEAAFNFYKSVFGGEFDYIGRYKDMPAGEHPIPDKYKEKIMHISLPISKEVTLMGGDSTEIYGEAKFGDNVTLCITTEDEPESRRVFDALSEGGTVIMPLEPTFWSVAFGHFVDKFGVYWMVNCCIEPDKK